MDPKHLTEIRNWAAPNFPTANPFTLADLGYRGIILYIGTPGQPWNCTPTYYQECKTAGLDVIARFWDKTPADAIGPNVGKTHALRCLADMTVCGMDIHMPVGPIIPRNVDHDTAIAYQHGFWSVCNGHPVIATGNANFLASVADVHAGEVFMQVSEPGYAPENAHFWVQPILNTIDDVTVHTWHQLVELPETPVPTARQVDQNDPITELTDAIDNFRMDMSEAISELTNVITKFDNTVQKWTNR